MPQPKMRFIPGVVPAAGTLRFRFNGQDISAHPGETIASALMRAGVQVLRHTRIEDQPRGYFCGMGICWECAVFVEGTGVVRSCGEPARDGMVIRLAEAGV